VSAKRFALQPAWLVAAAAAALMATALPANTVATASVFRPVADAQVASSHSTRNY
jgi:hypothetical protein